MKLSKSVSYAEYDLLIFSDYKLENIYENNLLGFVYAIEPVEYTWQTYTFAQINPYTLRYLYEEL